LDYVVSCGTRQTVDRGVPCIISTGGVGVGGGGGGWLLAGENMQQQ